jgi:hypothetical protein
MTGQYHLELMETLLLHKGYVMLFGYDNDIYNEYLQGGEK